MKKLTITLCLAAIFAVPVWSQTTWTTSKIGSYNGYDYELWSQDNAGTTSMVLNGDNGSGTNAKGGTFTATWSKTINVLFRSGRKFTNTSGQSLDGGGQGKTASAYGNISINFAATWSSTDNVKMLGVYGWAFFASGSQPSNFTNQIEYYIIQDRGSYNSATSGTNSSKKGSATIDGIAYDFYVCDRLNQPMLTGNGNFKQYFSVPQNTSSHRTSGTISVSKHFEEWAKVGMKMDGPLYEVALKVESYTGSNSNASGNATITKNILTIGGTSTTSSNSTGGTSSSSKANSSSSARTQTTTCKTPLITYPTNTVPSDPYTACFKYTNNKCYVCKVESEGEFEGNVNTCASGWVWDGSQIASNLSSGYWYYEVTCPATSSSSVASSSSRASSSSVASSSSSSVTITCTGLQATVEKGGTIVAPTITCSDGSRATSTTWSGRPGNNTSWTPTSDATSYNIGVSAVLCGSTSLSNLTVVCGTVTVITPTSSSSNAAGTSSSSSAEDSSSSSEDPTPILGNRIPLTNFSIQPQSDKSLRIEISSPAVVEIFNLKGNKVTSLNVSASQTVKLALPNGVYFAKAHGTKSIRFVLK